MINVIKDLIVQVNKSEIVKFFNSLMLEQKYTYSDEDSVSLLTIHKAKGVIDFQVVFFIGCN